MSHINVSMPSVTKAKLTKVRLSDFGGGVRLARFHETLSEAQSPYMKNMIYSGDILRSREGAVSVFPELMASGGVHSCITKEFFGWFMFHIGTCLYAVSPTEYAVVSEEVPDVQSFMFEMNSKMYLFCSDASVFIVDSELGFTEYELPEVLIMTEAKSTLEEYTLCEVPDNMLNGAVAIEYASTSGRNVFTIAHEPDTDFPIKLYNVDLGVELTKMTYTLEGRTLTLSSSIGARLRISYYPKKGQEYRSFDKIFGCRSAVCYGGKSSGGTRVFFAGNPDYPGYYFYSNLLDPLTVPQLSYDILGNGSKNITALAKQKSDLVAFCSDSVYRITYSFDSDTGPDFTVSEITPSVGCDIGGSVQLIDNRLVFASRGKGIFIIVSSDYTDELSVRSISANINGSGNDGGFLETASGVTECCSADFDRKYRLFIGDTCYVWDYGNTPYVPGTDPAYSERVLAWYMFEGTSAVCAFECEGALWALQEKEGAHGFVCFFEDALDDLGTAFESAVRTRDIDASLPEAKKVLYEVFATVLARSGTEVRVTVFGDGKEIASRDFTFTDTDIGQEEKLYRLYMKVPGYEAVRFSVELSAGAGRIGLHDAALRFFGDGIYYR